MRVLLLAVAVSACGVSSSPNIDADSGSPVIDAGGSAFDAGQVDSGTVAVDAGVATTGPIVAQAEKWSWVDFPDSMCGNGVPTGIGINPKSNNTEVWIYMQGGGACWEGLTCYTINAATHFSDGYTATTFANEGDLLLPGFNRAVSDNPFKNASFVFVPYCTGDVHAGDAVKVFNGSTANFHGAANVTAYLKRLKLTFPNATKVYLTGSSAGAFGAQLNFTRVSEAWPAAEVHVLADSGQMINPTGNLLGDWIAAWNVTVPASCVDCLTNFPKYIDWLTANNPTRRFALLAYSQDEVLRRFFNYMPAPYQVQTELLLTNQYDGKANAKYFYLAGSQHTMLGSQFTTVGNGGVSLNTFISKWYSGEPSWANVKP